MAAGALFGLNDTINLEGEKMRTNPDTLNEELKKHKARLASIAEELADSLKPYWPYIWLTDQTIAENAVENDDRTLVSVLKSLDAAWLFDHMKEELHILKNISSWKELKVKDITDDLLHTLSLRAARQEFPGKCEVCKDWV